MNSPHLYVTRLFSLLVLLCLAFNNVMADDRVVRGEVVLATGEVWKISGETRERSALHRGNVVFEGDVLESAEGAATLKMIDEGIISLHPFTRLHIHDYDPQKQRVRIELDNGRIDTKTGEISRSNRAGYRLNTPFAALGIRGTQYTAVLQNGQLDIHVQAGEIVLSPYSSEFNCTQDTFGPCNNPLSAALQADSGTWLQLKQGSAIRRIRGTPDFINTELPNYSNTLLPRDSLYNALGQRIDPDSSIKQALQDPLLSNRDDDSLPPNIPDTPGQQPDTPTKPQRYYTDLNSLSLSEEAYRNQLRRINLRSYAYKTLGRTNIYNFDINLFPVRATSIWIDPAQQRFWGQDKSLNSLLASRYWHEGQNLWSAMPANLEHLGAANPDWFYKVRDNDTSLWRLPLATQAIFFTPQDVTSAMQDTSRFTSVWTQPVRQSHNATPPPAWQITDLHAKAGEGFALTLTQGEESLEIKGQSDLSGVIFGANDQFKVRGHWHADSIILIIEDTQTNQLWMNGLVSLGAGQLSATQWNSRSTEDGVHWGHWSNFAQLSDEQVEMITNYLGPTTNNRHFALARPENSTLPTQGDHSFSLSNYEAVYASADTLLPAEVSNAELQVNFAQQSLETRFDLNAPGLEQTHHFEAQGQFNQNGHIEAHNDATQAQASGFIGKHGSTASLLFELPIDQDSYFSGMTHWIR